MKRQVIIPLAALLSVVALAGCAPEGNESSTSSGTPASTTITFWHDNDKAMMDYLASAATDALKDEHIVVKAVKKSGIQDQIKLYGNDASNGPDFFFGAHDAIGAYAEMGILSGIENFANAETLGGFMESTVDAGEYKGTKYLFPLYAETNLLFYNKDLWKGEMPTTTEGLLEYNKSRVEEGGYGFLNQYNDTYNAAPWVNGFGGFVIDANANPGINNAATKEAAAYNAKFAPTMSDGAYDTITNLFLEGKADGILAGPWFVSSVKEAGIDCGYVSLSRFALPNGKGLAPYEGVQGFAVMKYAEAKKEAIGKALEAMADVEVAKALAKDYNCTPALTAASNASEVTSNEMIKETQYTIAETAVPTPNIPEMGVMWTPFTNFLTAVNQGGDVDENAEKFQNEALQAIANMH